MGVGVCVCGGGGGVRRKRRGHHLRHKGLSEAASQVSTTSSFPVQPPCFETAQLTLTYQKQLINLFCIYRPPPSKKQQHNSMTPCFSISFPTFSDSLPGKTLLMGDFNFHFENVDTITPENYTIS